MAIRIGDSGRDDPFSSPVPTTASDGRPDVGAQVGKQALSDSYQTYTEIPESFHKVGLVGVIRRGEKVLLGQRLKNDEAFEKWVFPGGGLKGDETFQEGVQRECGEEVGLVLEIGNLIMATRSPHAGRTNVALIYWATPKGDDTEPIASNEIGNPGYFTFEEAWELDLMPATRLVLLEIEADLTQVSI